jgi:hypothetical protein
MRDQTKHLPVNWIDGMKINKNHFIAQDDAWKDALQDVASLNLSPLRYGILPPSAAGEETFDVKVSLDNQSVLRVNVLSLQAVTPGGVRIKLPALSLPGQAAGEGLPATTFPFAAASGENIYWVVLIINPYDRVPVGSPDLAENPPRYPSIMPSCEVMVIPDSQYRQYAAHPYALFAGKVVVDGNDIRVDEDYLPPCFSVSAHPDLLALHGELDQRLSNIELRCSQIVQKIYKKSQQNELSELVLFLCDRVMLYLGPAITNLRWLTAHESPARLFAEVVTLARIMKNTIDLRTGTGKDELMNYFTEWCELKQGEFMSMLSTISSFRFDNNDLNKDIRRIVAFVNITSRLFETLSNLEFIGKRKEAGIFVKEEQTFNQPNNGTDQPKQRRRFFG